MLLQKTFKSYIILLLLIVALVTGCSKSSTLQAVFKKQTPYEAYVASLKDAKLYNTALGSAWIEAGEKALNKAQLITLPYKEIGYFAADKPRAAIYSFDAKRGERVVISLQVKAQEQTSFFMDLFVRDESGNLSHIAYADTAATTLSYEVDEDRPYLLRIQPELLRNAQYTLTIELQPTLAFPLPGRSSRNISSIWGDPRDAGSRRHEGVDIFAPRGTPVVAATAGYISQVHTTPRGGKVVWLSDLNRRQALYYAHLDKQLVTTGQRVQVGDTLGLVGNTGNAISTAPHLHFGVYRFGHGAINPYPYLHQSTATAPIVKANLKQLGEWVRTTSRQTNIRQLPALKSEVYKSLTQHTPLQVLSATGNWYRVALPDGTEGYIASSVVQSMEAPVKRLKLKQQEQLLSAASTNAVTIQTIDAGSDVAILANFQNFKMVRNSNGDTGWLYQPGS